MKKTPLLLLLIVSHSLSSVFNLEEAVTFVRDQAKGLIEYDAIPFNAQIKGMLERVVVDDNEVPDDHITTQEIATVVGAPRRKSLAFDQVKLSTYLDLSVGEILKNSGFQAYGLEQLGSALQGMPPFLVERLVSEPPYSPFLEPVVCRDAPTEQFSGNATIKRFLTQFPDQAFQIAIYLIPKAQRSISFIYVVFHRPKIEKDPLVSLERLEKWTDQETLSQFHPLLWKLTRKDFDYKQDDIWRSRIKGTPFLPHMAGYFMGVHKTFREEAELGQSPYQLEDLRSEQEAQLLVSKLFQESLDPETEAMSSCFYAAVLLEGLIEANPDGTPNLEKAYQLLDNKMYVDNLAVQLFLKQCLVEKTRPLYERSEDSRHHPDMVKLCEVNERCAAAGDADSQYMRGRQVCSSVVDEGIPTEHAPTMDEALNWFRLAVKGGNKPASSQIAKIYMGFPALASILVPDPVIVDMLACVDKVDINRAASWYDRAALDGDKTAALNLCVMTSGDPELPSLYMDRLYQKGVRLRKSKCYKNAFDYFFIGAFFQKNPKSIHNIGSIFYQLEAYATAHQWFRTAAALGFEPAKNNLEKMQDSGVMQKQRLDPKKPRLSFNFQTAAAPKSIQIYTDGRVVADSSLPKGIVEMAQRFDDYDLIRELAFKDPKWSFSYPDFVTDLL